MGIAPQLTWEIGTAYDLFTSLDVIHNPARYGLRGSWAAGVRSRLPGEQREFLQNAADQHHIWMIPWLANQDGPKDSASVLHKLGEIPAEDRMREIVSCYMPDEVRTLLFRVADNGKWQPEDVKTLRVLLAQMYKEEMGRSKKIPEEELLDRLSVWAETAVYGQKMLNALTVYYDVFFKEEEARIQKPLEMRITEAKALANELSLPDLLNELSQGLRFEFEQIEEMEELIMIPSFWSTPLSMFTSFSRDKKRWLFLFGGRPNNVSLVPGEVVPELLYQMLKALADPTRLRILRYLSEEPLTPAELARRLRLRPPTVIHHLDALRLARLVHVTLSVNGRRYEARHEAIKNVSVMLNNFLAGEA
ncbi:ArsR/SmtB family transcription factor [Candidatus Leptofilum sp.]|uniref:ArsR/SmtB family transcription factor n=1 Tax=Candidatus Leptofilum sp. TaxID=3241576 RepID=UPI003B592658